MNNNPVKVSVSMSLPEISLVLNSRQDRDQDHVLLSNIQGQT